MIRMTVRALLLGAALSLPPAFAQEAAAPVAAGETADAATDAGSAAEAAGESEYVRSLRALAWTEGPTEVDIAGNSTLVVPEGYVFLPAKETTKFLELNQNFGNDREVMIAPASLEWSAYLEFEDSGYVKDDEKIDAAELLAQMKEGNESGNEERRRRGWPELKLLDWARPPAYNASTKRLEWATLLESQGGRSVNFSTKVLGRRGHTTVVLVSDPESLATSQVALNTLLDGYRFKSGDTYAEWVPGDKVAEYGLAALVLGGAAAVATKKGFWAVLAGFFATAWKFLLAGAVGVVAWLRKLAGKRGADAS